MTADDAQRAAGCVQQYSFERPAIPPARGLSRIALNDRAPMTQAIEGLADRRQPLCIPVESDQLSNLWTRLQDVGALAAGRGSGIQHTQTGLQLQVTRGKLCRRVLN